MKKIGLLLLALLLMSSFFISCSSPSTQGQPPESPVDVVPAEELSVEPVDINIVAMKGPTGMGMVRFMDLSEAGELKDHNYSFSLVPTADAVVALLAKNEVDIAAVPANLASVLYNNTNRSVQVIAVNTLGVLYIVESGETIQSVEDLKGKTIYASGMGTVPEYVFDYVLRQNGLDPATDVFMEWKTEQTENLAALMAKENTIAMLPQPFVTIAQNKSDTIRVALDLNKEWEELQKDSSNPSAMITGVVVVREEFAREHPEAVHAFLDHYQESVDYINQHVADGAELVAKYDIVAADVAEKAIPACNITFIDGNEMKEKLSGYLRVLMEQNPKSIGGQLPEDDFYFNRGDE